MTVHLDRASFTDRVHGAWVGKCIGATFGAQVEGGTGIQRADYFDPLPGQALAREEVDASLVLLHALRKHGPAADADRLAAVWRDHLRYASDEAGYADRNLARGLTSPLSGAFDNWFAHSAGALARSEVWGLTAPASPQQAAARAYADASRDHAEEGVWAAMLWSAMVSAAFAVPDVRGLLDVGLAMVPSTSRCARAVKAAQEAASGSASWVDARGRVLSVTRSSNITDAATNLGFACVGLLYGGTAFEVALRSAVNCGYATGITGGLIGGLLGVLLGREGVPARWADPIGDNAVIGWGVHKLPQPYTLTEVAQRTVEVAERAITDLELAVAIVDHGSEEPALAIPAPGEPPVGTPPTMPGEDAPVVEPAPLVAAPTMPDEDAPPAAPEMPDEAADGALQPQESAVEPSEAEPVPEPDAEPLEPAVAPVEPAPPQPAAPPQPDWRANDEVKPLLVRSPFVDVGRAGAFDVEVDFGPQGPVIVPDEARTLTFTVRNRAARPFVGSVSLTAPAGWQVAVPGAQGQRQMLAPGGFARYGFVLKAPAHVPVAASNPVRLVMLPEKGGPAETEFRLLGAACWWFAGPLRNLAEEGFTRPYEPETKPGLDQTYLGRDGGLLTWRKMAFPSVVMPIETEVLGGMPGVAYGQTTLHADRPTDVRLVVHCTDGVQVWLGGRSVVRLHAHVPFRPTPGYGDAAADVTLAAGSTSLLLKVVRCGQPVELAFMLADREGRLLDGLLPTGW